MTVRELLTELHEIHDLVDRMGSPHVPNPAAKRITMLMHRIDLDQPISPASIDVAHKSSSSEIVF